MRFEIRLLHIEVYADQPDETNAAAQQRMEKAFSEFLIDMSSNFNTAGEGMSNSFWHKMFALGRAIAEVWESGRCPYFSSIESLHKSDQ
ncbi:MAG: hypothetical protein WBP41_04480 [Saprospiraceae bacterium]